MDFNKVSTKTIVLTSLGLATMITTYKLYGYLKGLYQIYKVIKNLNPDIKSAQLYDYHIEIPYRYLNTNYIVRLPFDHNQVAKMSSFTLTGKKGDDEYDLTQQPGLNYYITADDLGVDYIMSYNEDTDEYKYFNTNQQMSFNFE